MQETVVSVKMSSGEMRKPEFSGTVVTVAAGETVCADVPSQNCRSDGPEVRPADGESGFPFSGLSLFCSANTESVNGDGAAGAVSAVSTGLQFVLTGIVRKISEENGVATGLADSCS